MAEVEMLSSCSVMRVGAVPSYRGQNMVFDASWSRDNQRCDLESGRARDIEEVSVESLEVGDVGLPSGVVVESWDVVAEFAELWCSLSSHCGCGRWSCILSDDA